MNEIEKENVFETLNRLTKTINENPLIQKLSHLVGIETGVVGGAVRDIYLDKPIKDIDIAIGLNFHKNLKVDYPKRSNNYDDELIVEQAAEADALENRNSQVLRLLGDEEYSFMHGFLLHRDKPITAIQAVVYLIRKIIEQNPDYSIMKVYDKNNVDMPIKDVKLREKAYEDIGLCAVVAISDQKANHPIELLFTPDRVAGFIDCFDFNLCKIFMQETNGQAEIIPSHDFVEDCKKMTITYKPHGDITEEKMNKSLFTRYERFKKKFPEYTLVTNTSFIYNKDMKEMIENTVKAVSLYHHLKQNTGEKIENKSLQKSKKI